MLKRLQLWAGLISSVVSIVLSIVATTFAVLVNNRSEKVSDETIRSLQKIESAMERLSEDTSGLIKAGWETMLGSVSGRSHREEAPVSTTAAKELASGIVTELQSEIGLTDKQQTDIKGEKEGSVLYENIQRAIEGLRETLEGQITAQPRASRPSAVFRKMRQLRNLSPAAQELASYIKGMHLTKSQYRSLKKGPLADAVGELRRAGVLTPLSGHGDAGEELLVYWFPSGQSKILRSALLLLPSRPSDVRDLVKRSLDEVKYVPWEE
jgi:hypothetical protein